MRENNGAISIIGERAKEETRRGGLSAAGMSFAERDSSARRLQLLLYAAQKSLTGHHRTGRGRGGIGGVGASGFCSIAHYKIYIINVYLYIHLAIILIIIYIM